MSKVMDITGQRYGRLVVIQRAGVNDDGLSIWLCKCDCGTEKITAAKYLRAGNTRSCGCLYAETSLKNLPKNPAAKRKPKAAVKRLEPDKPEVISTGFNWCGIPPFHDPYRVCGYGWPEENERV